MEHLRQHISPLPGNRVVEENGSQEVEKLQLSAGATSSTELQQLLRAGTSVAC